MYFQTLLQEVTVCTVICSFWMLLLPDISKTLMTTAKSWGALTHNSSVNNLVHKYSFKLLTVCEFCLPVLSFCIGGRWVQNSLVVLHVHDTFCIQFNFCREKFVWKVKQNAGVWRIKSELLWPSLNYSQVWLQAHNSNWKQQWRRNQKFMVMWHEAKETEKESASRNRRYNTYPCGSWAELSLQLLPLYPTFSSTFHSHPVYSPSYQRRVSDKKARLFARKQGKRI